MSGQEIPKPRFPASPPGNLLSSVAPPAALPNFLTTPAPQQSSENLIKNESGNESAATQPAVRPQTLPNSESSDFLQSTFSPVIPANMGVPTEALSPPATDVEEAEEVGQEMRYVGDIMPGSGLLAWARGAVGGVGLLQRVAERARSSVDTMITTLDPQMKEYIYSGGDTEILVASDKEDKISPIREAFQTVFGKATVIGFPAQSSMIASQPVGFAAAISSAKDRIAALRSSNAKIADNVPIVALENFILEVTNDRWFDLGVLVLTDPTAGISLEAFTQMTAVPLAVIAAAKGDTPEDYEHKDTGFLNTIGSYMADNLKVHHSEWHEASCGVSRREMINLAARSLATSYKKIISDTDEK